MQQPHQQQQKQSQQHQQAQGGGSNAQKSHPGKHSRNNKRRHHATHEAGGHQHHRQNRQHHQQYDNGFVACKICRQELQDLEKEFFPCNCKYKICQKCFWHHVDHENGKCPNCGLLYEVNRVKDYYATKQAARSAVQLQGPSGKKTRCESPQPSMTPVSSLAQSQPQSASMKVMAPTMQQPGEVSASGKLPNQQRGKQAQNSGKQKGQPGKNAARQQNQQPQQRHSTKATPGSTAAAGTEAQPASDSLGKSGQAQQSTLQQSKQQNQQNQAQQRPPLVVETRPSKKQRNSSEQQRLQQKLSSVRILQRNTLYVIGLSPNVAKEETLRRYEYFSQYGRILTVTINKEKAFQSENQGLCFSAYINYASEREASLAILAVDQFVFDGRLLHASYGRTKYCRFFLKGTNCLNHECPYLHREAHPENILTQEDMNKKILFQQCQQLALKLSKLTAQPEEQFRASLRAHKEGVMRAMKLTHTNRIIMPQLEQVFDKKGLFKHCLGVAGAGQDAPSGGPPPQRQLPVAQPIQANHGSHIGQAALAGSSTLKVNPTGNNLPAYNQNQKQAELQPQVPVAGGPPQGAAPDMGQGTFRQHRGSEGCNSEMQASNPNVMMMFGGRVRLQSSGTLGELDFQNQNGAGQSRWQQLIPHGSANQSRRFAQDDHYLTRVPAAFRLSTANPANDGQAVNMALANQQSNTFGRLQPRFGSPHLPQSRLHFNQQFMVRQQNPPPSLPQPAAGAPRDSDKATQQSGSLQYHAAQQFQMSQLHYQPHFLPHGAQVPTDPRARSGSQAAAATGQFEEAKIAPRRRKSSHGKFRIFEEPRKESPSPGNKEEQRRFASALRQALQQVVKGDTAQEGESTGQFSSIFAGGERMVPNKIIFNQNNCSEGVAAGHACSPIRDSILQSRRNSEDYGTLTRPRSQHSLIVESVARILDDTALEQRGGDRERHQRLQTGPPSEVHQLMHEEQPLALNSHFYTDFESKWNNQFDLASSNSLNLTNPAAHGGAKLTVPQRKSQIDQQAHPQPQQPQHAHINQQQQQQQHHHTFTSPNMNTSAGGGGVWNKSGSFYNSPFFLIPTHTSNQQHRSAAFHDHSLRHLHSHSNPFSLGGLNTTIERRTNGGMVSDTWRLTYNPHPLLPRAGPGAAQSSNLSSAGGLFRNTTTQSDQLDHTRLGGGAPMLSRTTSQPFMMRSEQKVIRGNATQAKAQRSTLDNSAQHLEFSSQMKQAQLTQRNLEILNKKYCPSKDMLYAKIFTDYVPSSSPSNQRNTSNQVNSFGGMAPQHPISVQHYITPQSLFCFALDGDDSNELRKSKLGNLKLTKQVSRDDAAAGILSTPTRRKEQASFFFNSSNLDKVKETSMTPKNKHSRAIATNWNEYNRNHDTRSVQNEQPGEPSRHGSGLLPHETFAPVSADEIEMANQLANEASLGFGDLYSLMLSKSKKSQYERTQMSAVGGEPPPQRSRSQSYRDNKKAGEAQFEESERKTRRDLLGGSNFSNRRDSSNRSGNSSLAQKRNLTMKNQQTSQGQSAATATTTGGQKNFYQEFVKVQEGFRKSSGLVSSSGFGATKVETRRSSYSQGRNSSNRTSIQLMDVTRRGSFKNGSLRRSMIISPLGLLKFKNHQIDEVAEDGATARDERLENEEEPTSVRMNSADRQSYNLKTLKSVSRSRKASQSQNGNNCD